MNLEYFLRFLIGIKLKVRSNEQTEPSMAHIRPYSRTKVLQYPLHQIDRNPLFHTGREGTRSEVPAGFLSLRTIYILALGNSYFGELPCVFCHIWQHLWPLPTKSSNTHASLCENQKYLQLLSNVPRVGETKTVPSRELFGQNIKYFFLLLFFYTSIQIERASLITQLVNNLPAIQETLVGFLGLEDLLEKRQSTHFSILGLPLWLS